VEQSQSHVRDRRSAGRRIDPAPARAPDSRRRVARGGWLVFGPSWRSLVDAAALPKRGAWWRRKRDELIALANERSPRYVYSIEHVREQARALRTLSA